MATQGVSLQDALTNVHCLESLALPDEQPTIEPEPASVVYEVSFDTNFADRTAFITGIGKYNEEATICSNLVRGGARPEEGASEREGREMVEGVVEFMRHAMAPHSLCVVVYCIVTLCFRLLVMCSVVSCGT